MFRYLEKYVGKYRVLPELDLDTNDVPRDEKGSIDPTYDDLYIPCRKGYIKNSAEDYYLCWFGDTLSLGRRVKKDFEIAKIPIYKYEETDIDVLIWFDIKYINKVASIVKPKTNGKNIKPFSKRNFKKEKEKASYTIPLKDYERYSSIMKDMSTVEKMQFARSCNNNFSDIVVKKMGNNYNINEELYDSGLDYKTFIHSIGLWEDYIEYVNNEYKKLHK